MDIYMHASCHQSSALGQTDSLPRTYSVGAIIGKLLPRECMHPSPSRLSLVQQQYRGSSLTVTAQDSHLSTAASLPGPKYYHSTKHFSVPLHCCYTGHSLYRPGCPQVAVLDKCLIYCYRSRIRTSLVVTAACYASLVA